jgi:hypothetical protein
MDPYRVLGLTAGATQAEVKRAYRALAKQFHPDSAGPAALPRFLAIQEAYESLVVGHAQGSRRAARATAKPWTADPDRARATGDPYRARRSRTTGGRPGAGARTSDKTGGGRRTRGPERPPDRATPGSTSYDGADGEPFSPDWQGGAWYGASSGTYWTVNPKEYADPRKHGPEYQARGRRPDDWAGPEGSAHSGGGSTTEAGGSSAQAGWTAPPRPGRSRPAPGPRFAATSPAPADVDTPSGPSTIERLLRGEIRTPVARVVLTLLGWPPLAVGLGALAGEASGCSRFAAGCPDVAAPVTLGAQLAIALVLLAFPRLAGIAAAGAIGMLLAALPATAALVPNEGPVGSTGNGWFASVVLVVGWLGGAALATYRREPEPAESVGAGPAS